MVTTRNMTADAEADVKRERVRAGLKLTAALLSLILLVAYGPKVIMGTGHQAKGLWQRATGSHQQPESMSWDDVKEWASSQGQVLPKPTKTQLIRSKATNTPIAQIQSQDLLQHVQQTLQKQKSYAMNAASDAAAAAACKFGDVKDAASSKAGEYMDAAKCRTLPAPTLTQRLWSAITFKPVQQTQVEGMYGYLKGRASDAAASGQQTAAEVLEGARDAVPDEGTWAWMKRLVTGRSQAQVHYDAAKGSVGDASEHLSQAAAEAYEAVRAAGGAASSAAASAWHADPAGHAAQASKGAAGTVYDSAKSYVDAAGNTVSNTKDAVSGRIETSKQKVGEMYETVAEAVSSTTGHARAETSLSGEKARHRVEEEAQKLKHFGEEKLHAARA